MINGAHIVLYTTDPKADRTFFRDVLDFSSVDAGHGRLIFALPPAKAAFHDFEQKDSEQKASRVARAPSPAFSERTHAQQEKSDPATTPTTK